MTANELNKPKNSLHWLWPARRPCGAMTRSGLPCRKWAMKSGRCRLHGGCSTGQRTPEGRERSRKANFKHGRYSLDTCKQRTIKRLVKLFPDRQPRIVEFITPMSLKEFLSFRHRLHTYLIARKKTTHGRCWRYVLKYF